MTSKNITDQVGLFLGWTVQADYSNTGKICARSTLGEGVRIYFPDAGVKGSIDWCIASCLQFMPEDCISAEELQTHLDILLAKYAPQQTATT